MLGASLAVTNKLQMACALRAECRWIMTGTPKAGPGWIHAPCALDSVFCWRPSLPYTLPYGLSARQGRLSAWLSICSRAPQGTSLALLGVSRHPGPCRCCQQARVTSSMGSDLTMGCPGLQLLHASRVARPVWTACGDLSIHIHLCTCFVCRQFRPYLPAPTLVSITYLMQCLQLFDTCLAFVQAPPHLPPTAPTCPTCSPCSASCTMSLMECSAASGRWAASMHANSAWTTYFLTKACVAEQSTCSHSTCEA